MVIVDQIIFVCGFHLEQIHSSASAETIRSRPVSHLLNKFPAWETVVDFRVVDVVEVDEASFVVG